MSACSITRGATASVATLALALGLTTTATAAGQLADRVAGDNRFGTAVEQSKLSFKSTGSADAVVLARADTYADALAGSALAADSNAPLLLTASHELTEVTAGEIERVLPKGGTVYLLGGETAVAPAVADALEELGYVVERLAGSNRYGTALAVAEEVGEFDSIMLATGENFPDALSAGNAAAATDGIVLLTKDDVLTPETLQFLEDSANEDVYAIGGPAQRAAAAVDLPVVGVFGDDRYETAVDVAERFFEPGAGLWGVALASGENFPDALASGVGAGRNGNPVVLTKPDEFPEVTDGYVRAVAAPAGRLVLGFVIGGEAAVSAEVEEAFEAALTGVVVDPEPPVDPGLPVEPTP